MSRGLKGQETVFRRLYRWVYLFIKTSYKLYFCSFNYAFTKKMYVYRNCTNVSLSRTDCAVRTEPTLTWGEKKKNKVVRRKKTFGDSIILKFHMQFPTQEEVGVSCLRKRACACVSGFPDLFRCLCKHDYLRHLPKKKPPIQPSLFFLPTHSDLLGYDVL